MGIEGKLADLSDCVLSYSTYITGGVLERAISMDSVNVTAWSCLHVNRLPSATSTVG